MKRVTQKQINAAWGEYSTAMQNWGGHNQVTQRALAKVYELKSQWEKENPGRKSNPLPRRHNPVNRPAGGERSALIEKARRLYQDFSGHAGEFEVLRVKIPAAPGAVCAIGECDGIEYTCVREGKTERYIHRFKKASRPLLCCSPDGKQLFLVGGSFEFGERGIVDK